jgi:hypothetical protein
VFLGSISMCMLLLQERCTRSCCIFNSTRFIQLNEGHISSARICVGYKKVGGRHVFKDRIALLTSLEKKEA